MFIVSKGDRMKKLNGFTLIELMGVLVVIGLVVIVSFTVIPNMLKSSNDKAYQSFLNNLYLATETYLNDNPIDTEGETTILVEDLIDAGLIKERIKNPNTKEYISATDIIKITSTKNSNGILEYSYEYIESVE